MLKFKIDVRKLSDPTPPNPNPMQILTEDGAILLAAPSMKVLTEQLVEAVTDGRIQANDLPQPFQSAISAMVASSGFILNY